MDVSTSVLSSGLAGMQAGQQRVERAAVEIAGGVSAAPGDSLSLSDMATQMVEMNIGRLEVQASARVVETADELLGTLVNIHA